MTKNKIAVKSSIVDLTFFQLFKYGGSSKVYLDTANNVIYKKYFRLSDNNRKQILGNFVALEENAAKIDDKDLILPNTIYLDSEGLVDVQEMNYIDGICGVTNLRKNYMTKKYYLIIYRLINLVKKYTNRMFVVEDLKLSNIVFDRSLNPSIIDNDFTKVGEINCKLSQVKNCYMKTYLRNFSDTIKPDYNLFNLYFMIAMLLLTEEEFKCALSVKNYPSYENLVAINYFIQKNRGIPMSFKKELNNLFLAQREITFSESVRDDISEFVLSRSKVN